MHPALGPVHSCRTLEFCPRIARLSTELRCPPVYILATNRGCTQCNFLHSQSRQIPFWACHSACWKRGIQGPGTAKMQQTVDGGESFSTVGLPEESVPARTGRRWPRPSAPTALPPGDARCCIRSGWTCAACLRRRCRYLPRFFRGSPLLLETQVWASDLMPSLSLWAMYNAARSPFTNSSRT